MAADASILRDLRLPSAFFAVGSVTLEVWREAKSNQAKDGDLKPEIQSPASSVDDLPGQETTTSVQKNDLNASVDNDDAVDYLDRRLTQGDKQTELRQRRAKQTGEHAPALPPRKKVRRRARLQLPGELALAPSVSGIQAQSSDPNGFGSASSEDSIEEVDHALEVAECLPVSVSAFGRTHHSTDNKEQPVKLGGITPQKFREHDGLRRFSRVVGDGFDNHELIPIRQRVTEVPRRVRHSKAFAHCGHLTLTTSIEIYEDSQIQPQQPATDENVKARKRERRLKTSKNFIASQLMSLTAPPRQNSGGEASEEEYQHDARPHHPFPSNIPTDGDVGLIQPDNGDPLTSEALIRDDYTPNRLEPGSNHTKVATFSASGLNHRHEDALLYAGQVARSHSIGPWMQIEEDIHEVPSDIDGDDNGDDDGGEDCCEDVSGGLPITIARWLQKLMCNPTERTWLESRTASNATTSYFASAEAQLCVPRGRGHSVVPRKQSVSFAHVMESHEVEQEHFIERAVATTNPRHTSIGMPHVPPGLRRLANQEVVSTVTSSNLRSLVRRTSQDFGTIASYKKLPPLPFDPPFVANQGVNAAEV